MAREGIASGGGPTTAAMEETASGTGSTSPRREGTRDAQEEADIKGAITESSVPHGGEAIRKPSSPHHAVMRVTADRSHRSGYSPDAEEREASQRRQYPSNSCGL